MSIISKWASEFGDYILPGEAPPMTITKEVLINESRGDVLNHWHDILEAAE